MSTSPHLWLALSPHGFGHAAMTAPLVAELRRRRPGLRLTIQTRLPDELLVSRYGRFDYVEGIPDFGFCMRSAVDVDVEASAGRYMALHADFEALVEAEAARLRTARPDLVLANVPYVTVAAAARAGIPVAAYSSLNWADMADHYLGHLPECDRLRAEIRASYAQAAVFLRPEPAQIMTLPRLRHIGPVVSAGKRCGAEIRHRLGLAADIRLGVIAFGGIDHCLALDQWAELPGWFWLTSLADVPHRPDMAHWQAAGVAFSDLLASADVFVGKPGYGTFTEIAIAGVPMLYEPRPGWPETPPQEEWLARHTQCLPAHMAEMMTDLPALLRKLFSLPRQPVAVPSGIAEGADVLEALLDGAPSPYVVDGRA